MHSRTKAKGKRPDYTELNKGNRVQKDINKPLNTNTSVNDELQHSDEPVVEPNNTTVETSHTSSESINNTTVDTPQASLESISNPIMSSDEDEKKAVVKTPGLTGAGSTTGTSSNSNSAKLFGQADALEEDIIDFIDENPVVSMSKIDDIDSAIKRIEERRSGYRAKHRELQRLLDNDYKTETQEAYNKILNSVKTYIKEVQAKRTLLRVGEDTAKNKAVLAKGEKLGFLRNEIKRITKELQIAFNKDVSEETNEEITKRKKEFPDQSKKVETLSKHIQQIIELGADMPEVKEIKEGYEGIVDAKENYYSSLNSEDKSREIEKQKSFNKSSLGIKLDKFKGYNSNIDVYTFKDQFEKVHLKETPKNLLPDLLKNNFLDEPALSLVKNVTDVDEIWQRLKDAYGDCKIMLSKKLSEFNTIGETWKQSDPSKVVESLSKIINLMKDLLQLVKRHDIENNLYFGGAIENVYHLLGHVRLNRWLLNYDIDLKGESQWLKLMEFLEKELKVAQQHANIMASQPKKSPKDRDQDKDKDKTSLSKRIYNTGDNNNRPPHNNGLCSYCGEAGHVQTNGPGGMKLVQYFSCKKFVESSCSQRLNTIFTKGFCIQCLFPGASVAQGKHKEGNCQRDFICQHPSHAKYPVKKHVLLCSDHKDTSENKEVLEKYKARCIVRQRNLPDYAKEIQLYYCASPAMSTTTIPSPHSSTTNEHDVNNNASADQKSLQLTTAEVSEIVNIKTSNDDQYVQEIYLNNTDNDGFVINEENGIYILQTIQDTTGETYNLFFDLGCGRFCSKYSAVKRLNTNNARQLSTVAMPIGGVGGKISTIAYHGIYSIKIPLADGQSDAVLAGPCLDQITEVFPTYPLQELESDIRQAYNEYGGNLLHLPNLPSSVGRSV